MSYKLIILGASAAGKSTLMRYLREHTKLNIVETDEEVMRLNNNVYPDDGDHKNQVLIPKAMEAVLKQNDVIFMASYVPEALLVKAHKHGFKIILLEIHISTLQERNKKRMTEENYDDASPWLKGQLEDYDNLKAKGLVDYSFNGDRLVEEIAGDIVKFAHKA